jgi:hypothetical protein
MTFGREEDPRHASGTDLAFDRVMRGKTRAQGP